jgi:hypothetical protein
MPLTVTQPVINNSTGRAGGTLNLVPTDITDFSVTSSLVLASVVSTGATPNGRFVLLTFAASTHGYAVEAQPTVGDFFIVKNVGAITGTVRLFTNVASAINGVNIGAGSYMDFGLSSGKKIIVYVGTALNISVTYL